MKPRPILGAAARASASRCNCCLSGNYINQKPLRHRAAALLNGVSVRARSSGRDFRHLSRGGHLLGSWSTCPSRNSGPVVRFTGDRKREGAGGDPILATKRLGGGNSREDSATTPIDSGARFRRESGNCGPDCWRRQQWTRVGGCCVLRILTRRNPHLRIVGP